MNIFIRRPGELSNRIYPVHKARLKLAQGVLSPNDVAWCKGVSAWAPLSKILAVAEGQSRENSLQPDVAVPYKITSHELGMQCFNLVTGFEDSYINSIQNLQNAADSSQRLDLGQVWVEMICLGVFVIDYGIQTALKYGLMEEVLYAYRSHLKRLKINGIPDFYQLICYRILGYTSVLNDNGGSPQTIPWKVGEAFATLCGAELNERLQSIGIALYENIFGSVTQWIRGIGVENITE